MNTSTGTENATDKVANLVALHAGDSQAEEDRITTEIGKLFSYHSRLMLRCNDPDTKPVRIEMTSPSNSTKQETMLLHIPNPTKFMRRIRNSKPSQSP